MTAVNPSGPGLPDAVAMRPPTAGRRSPLSLLAALCALVGACSDDASNGAPADLSSAVDQAGDLAAAPDLAPAALWSPRTSGTAADLHGAWGSSPSDLFVVGDAGTILHSSDGRSFVTQAAPVQLALRGVWGSGPSDVYAVGDAGTLLHYDGAAWSARGSGVRLDLFGVGGTSAGDVYAVGAMGLILHSTDGGATWPKVPPLDPPLAATLRTVVAVGMTVWAGGDAGNLVIHTDHFGPFTWILRNISSPENVTSLYVTTASPLGLWSAADDGSLRYSFDGLIWPRQPGAPATAMRGVWGSSDGDVYAVGDGGLICHLTTLHTPFAVEDSGTTHRLEAVWGSGAGDVYAVGQAGTILHGP